MKRSGFGLVLVLTAAILARAQNESGTLDEAMQSAQQWAKENLDENALKAFESADQQKLKGFFADVQKRFHGDYVLDLAALKDTAKTMLPLLESYEETAPYAAWLKAQLDYLDVAEQFRLTIPAPRGKPGEPPRPAANPAPQVEREVWIKKVAQRRVPEEAKAYVSKLKPIFAAQKIPPELVWMAEVESSFDPSARSPAGAAGLFQLTPATAKRYGLRTWPLDQRCRPEPSAEGAAKYLHYLHGHYQDWRLALAAYNAGEGTVDRLLARQKTRAFDAIATRLPAETQMYVPRIEAVVWRREGVRLSELKP